MSEVVVSAANGACRIELNRPDCGNLVTTGMVGELARALQSVAADVKLVVITGRGADFCKGRDYQSAPESAVADKGAPSALDIRERMTGPMMTLYTLLREAPVPTLSVVRGAAYGFGCALAGGAYFMGAMFVSPDSAFDINGVVMMLFATLIGGIGTIEGPVIGVLVWFALRELLTGPVGLQGGWYLMVMGGVAMT